MCARQQWRGFVLSGEVLEMLDGDTESVEVESQSLLLGRGGGGGRQSGGKEGRMEEMDNLV